MHRVEIEIIQRICSSNIHWFIARIARVCYFSFDVKINWKQKKNVKLKQIFKTFKLISKWFIFTHTISERGEHKKIYIFNCVFPLRISLSVGHLVFIIVQNMKTDNLSYSLIFVANKKHLMCAIWIIYAHCT